jgi:hypothetical protein
MSKDDPLYNGILYAVLGCLLILGLIMITSNLGNEEYLELSFTDVSSLPKIVTWGEEESFSFVLGNKYSTPQKIEYDIIMELDGKSTSLSKGSINLDPMKNEAITVKFTIDDLFEKGKIMVQVQDLEIYFNIVLQP